MSIKKLQRELIKAVVYAGVVLIQLVGAYVDARIKGAAFTKKSVRVVVKMVGVTLMWLVAQHMTWK